MNEPVYPGETSDRRPAVALLLSVVAPGLGWAYLGQIGLAVALNLIAVGVWVAFVVGWAAIRFNPALPALVYGFGWLWLLAMSAIDAAGQAERTGRNFVLRDANHPLIYAAVALLSFWLPLAGVATMSSRIVMTTHVQHDESNWPTVVSGDRVLIDLTAHRARDVRRGELVLFRAPTTGEVRLGRVVGLPGEQVVLADGVPYVNDTPLARSTLSSSGLTDLLAVVGAEAPGFQILVESDGIASWTIAEPMTTHWGDALTWEIPPESFFVLSDNRSDVGDSRTAGPVHSSAVLGSAVLVRASLGGEDTAWYLGLPTCLANFAASLDPSASAAQWRQARAGRTVQRL